MSDPTPVTVSPGETEEIINAADAESGIPYLVEVQDNPVRFAHEPANASRGAELSPGQTHTLSNLRDQPIYITARGGEATVRVRPAGAAVKTQPPKGVTVEGDVTIGSEIDVTDDQTREIGKARVMDSGGVLVDPPTESKQDQIISLLQDIKSNTSN
jgi:hypothetical protein